MFAYFHRAQQNRQILRVTILAFYLLTRFLRIIIFQFCLYKLNEHVLLRLKIYVSAIFATLLQPHTGLFRKFVRFFLQLTFSTVSVEVKEDQVTI